MQSISPGAPLDRQETDHDGVPGAWRRQAQDAADSAAGDLAPGAGDRPRGRRGRVAAAAVAGVVIVGALAVAAVLAFRPGTGPDDADPAPSTSPSAILRAVPAPTDLVGTRAADGSSSFTWANPDPQEADQYLWAVVTPGTEPAMTVVAAPAVSVEPSALTAPVCVEVSIVRADGRYSTAPAVGCTDR